MKQRRRINRWPVVAMLAFSVSPAFAGEPPAADAGANQSVALGTLVHLDGRRSTNRNGAALRYRWILRSNPAESAAVLSAADVAEPSLTLDAAGTYVADLTVCDPQACGAPATTVIGTGAVPPVAKAALHGMPRIGEPVILDGSQSSHSGAVPLRYEWTLLSKPEGSGAELIDAATPVPSFTPDREGIYLARLTVTGEGGLSSAATLAIRTGECPAPTAAPVFASVAAGKKVTLRGNLSTSACGQPLTYRWALISAPAGSGASLTDAAGVTSAFNPDLPGTYTAQLTVSDGARESEPNTLTWKTTMSGPSIILPANFVSQPAQRLNYPVTLSEPAPVGGVTVTLASGNPAVAYISPNTVTFAEGFTTPVAPPQVVGVRLGTAHITASAPGYASDTEPIVQAAEPVFFPNVGQDSAPGLGEPFFILSGIPNMTLTSSDPSIVNPPSPVGNDQIFQILGLKPGTAIITATAPNMIPATLPFTASTLSPIFLSCDFSHLGFNMEQKCGLSVPYYVDTTNLTITVTTADPAKLLVSNQFGKPGQSITVTGSNFFQQNYIKILPAFFLQGMVGSGSSTLTASAPGLASATITIQFVPTSFYFSENNFDFTLGPGTAPFSVPLVTAVQGVTPDSLHFESLRSNIPVQLTSSDPTVAAVSGNTLTPLHAGSTILSIVQPPGYAPGVLPAGFTNALVTIEPGPLTVSCLSSGNQSLGFLVSVGEQLSCTVQLPPGVDTPPAAATLTANASGLLFSSSPSTAGSSTLQVAFNAQGAAMFFLQNIGVSSNSIAFTASAAGLPVANLQAGPPPGPSSIAFNAMNLEVNAGTATNLVLSLASPLAGGLSLPVTIASSNPAVGLVTSGVNFTGGQQNATVPFKALAPGTTTLTIVSGSPAFQAALQMQVVVVSTAANSISFSQPVLQVESGSSQAITLRLGQPLPQGVTLTVAFSGGVSANNVTFTEGMSTATVEVDSSFAPLGLNTLKIEPLSTGYQTGPPLEVNVVPGTEEGFTRSCEGASLGYNLETLCTVTVSQAFARGPNFVQVTSLSPSLALSLDPAMPGLSTVTLNFAGTTTQSFWVQNIHASAGAPALVISGAGYLDTYTFLTLARTAFSFTNASATQSASGGTVSYQIEPYALLSDNAVFAQTLRPGVTASLYIANLRNTVGNVANPVVVNGGTASASVAFTPVGPGQDVLCIDQPAGYVESSNLNEVTITVQ